MKPFADYDKTETFQGGERLPKGAYLLKILNAVVKQEKNYNGEMQDRLNISLDIAEGDFKDFYLHQYMANNSEDKKWKCVFKMWCPKDDGSEDDAKTKKMFKTKILEIEASNEGYHWDWNEAGLKNKVIGGLFIDKEYDFDGRTGWYTALKFLCPAHQIADGSYKMPADEPLKDKPAPAVTGDEPFMQANDAGLPWN